jgi:hypothetical protein
MTTRCTRSRPAVALPAAALLSAALFALAGGCGGAQHGPAPDVRESAATASSSVVRRGVVRGDAAVAAVDRVTVEVRHNPAPCECPAWEVRLGAAWVRADLVEARDAQPWVAEVLGQELDEGARFRASLDPRGAGVVAGAGWTYPVFAVSDVTDAGGRR